MKKIFLFTAMAFACMMQAKTVTLDVAHPLNPESLEFDEKGVWTETYNEEDYETIDYQSMSFFHSAYADWNFWYGFTIAECQDTTYETMNDQFRCVAGGGLAGKGTPYVLAYAMEGMGPVSPCQTYFDGAYTAKEVYLCIGSWALHNVAVGGAGHTFAAGDSLVVEIEGLDENYDVIEGKKVTFFLADYRSTNESEWTLNKGWEKCDLSELGEVYGLVFTMKSSDVGQYGTNTALYFALDGLKISVPVVATFENEEGGINLTTAESAWQGADEPQIGWNTWKSGDYTFNTFVDNSYGMYYSAFTVTNETANTSTGSAEPYRSAKGGAYEGDNFVVWNLNYYGVDTITFDKQVVRGFFVNNTAYAVNSMTNGDSFAKKFGKDDWFKLTCVGVLDGAEVARLDVDLAKEGKYINEWTFVDLSELGEIDGLTFEMSSSDASQWGMNTPAYFAMDNFGAAEPADYEEPAMAEFEDAETAVENTTVAVKAQKAIRDGQVLIIRDGKAINLLGVEVR